MDDNRQSMIKRNSENEEILEQISDGKLKISISPTTLVIKYMNKMFETILESMKQTVQTKEKKHLKTFVIYSSKFEIIGEILIASM